MSRRPNGILASLSTATKEAAVLDWEHLSQYTMADAQLEREIIGLFLVQMPSTLAMLRSAASPQDWKLATHTLKGSAMAVGAMRIARIAAELEKLDIAENKARQTLLAALDAEIAAVREVGQSH